MEEFWELRPGVFQGLELGGLSSENSGERDRETETEREREREREVLQRPSHHFRKEEETL